MKRRKEVILPKIYRPPSGEYDKWFVYFSVYDDYTDKLRRFRKYEGFKKCKSVEDCEKNAKRLKRKYTDKLKTGWNPLFDNKDVIWSDSLAYHEDVKQNRKGRKSKRTIHYYSSKFLSSITPNIGHGTMQKYQSELRIFKHWLVKKKLDNIDISVFTAKDAKSFFDHLDSENKVSGKSKNNYLLILKRVWNYAREERKLLINPWNSIPKYKEITIPQVPLKKGVLELLKATLEEHDPQLWLAAQFMYYCFIRPKELRFMQIKHIDFDYGRITLTADITKPNKTRIVDIHGEFLREIVLKYKLNTYPEEYFVFSALRTPSTSPVGKNYFWSRFDSVRTHLNLPKDYKFYGFKHTGAVSALKAGADIKEIQNQMGHSSISITDEYLKNMVGYESDFFKKQMPKI